MTIPQAVARLLINYKPYRSLRPDVAYDVARRLSSGEHSFHRTKRMVDTLIDMDNDLKALGLEGTIQ